MVRTENTQSVRKGEELDTRVLEEFLKAHVAGFPDSHLEIRQFGAGHSNLTYELKAGDWQSVLRRPPKGPVAPKAHDMKREYSLLKAVHPVFPLAPAPILFNNQLFKFPFFLMERRKGIVFDSDIPNELLSCPNLGEKLSETMVERLVELHTIDYQKTDLAAMVKPEGFMERQVHGWIQRFERAGTDDVDSGSRVIQWLKNHIPENTEAAVIHYDYKFNNAMFDSTDPCKMTGLFDWEMATVGDPLADLGAAMSYWIEDSDPELLKNGLGKPPVTVKKGFYTRRKFIERYAEKSGRNIDQIKIYLTFAYFKLAGIVQQIYYRYKNGQTNDPRFAHMNQFVNALLKQAEQQAGLS
ncbi:phosphotransferase family protein [Halobacillus salinarum]|uniref:Phosphotransferase family protein n=1 Tax=Halobacillus salinarum TaxID=2932257 RepID=A0ABY4EIJ5_9BACI|nr:phosphotransferase family protein [Halobacillus salinarum]UOQ43873.1 phosphotransferase family protein [Halobacillus salinarum]